ncbi:MAG: flagellar biosynthetic protein FliR [Chloroherpetonaceae bacterium]|nr:flagellar biosynthetic protein FliR [bacterium]
MLDSATLNLLMGKFVISLLFFIRISSFLFIAPVFSNSGTMPQLKIILGLILTLIVTTTFWDIQPQIDYHLWNIALIALKELMVGFAIGFSAQLVFYAARFAGGLIDFDMGFHTSLLFDQNASSPSLIGQVFDLVVLMVFLLINGHHFLIETLFVSFKVVPLTVAVPSEATISILAKFASSIFIIAIKIAAPAIIALFIANLALALLSRIAPQTNIFVLSFQVKVVVGLLVLLISVPFIVYFIKYSLQDFQSLTMQWLMSLAPRGV